MPLTRIKQTAIGADAITTAKLDDTAGGLGLPGVQYVHVPVGTTAQRPSTAANGQLRYNTDFARLEQYAGGAWQAIDSPPTITTLAYSGSNNATEPAGGETITLSGTNFQAGATVTVGGTSASSVAVPSSTTITFAAPAKTAGDYDVIVTNSNGLTARLTSGISYNGTPAFTTAAGNIGSLNPDVAMPTITIVAAEPDGGTLAFSVTSGALPAGLSLGSANGQITGTPTGPATETTSTFTVTATDDENQTNTRQFNLIVFRPVYSRVLAHSVRFDSSHSNYLNRDNRNIGSGMAAGGQTFTVACWVKKGQDTTKDLYLIGSRTGTNADFLVYVNGQQLRFFGRNSSNQVTYDVRAPNQIIDGSSWYHVMMVGDFSNSTADDTTRFYVNGVRVPQSLVTTSNSAQNNGAHGTGLQDFYIGTHDSSYSDGYIADYHFIWNVAKTDPFEFIENYRGVLIPKTYTGSFGTYGFHLDFADSALTSSGIGDDNAGIGDFTPTNFPAEGAEYATGCVATDTPTSNHSTLYDGTHIGVSFTKGLTRSTKSGDRYFAAGNTGLREGKWYYEMRSTHYNASGGVVFGMVPVAEFGEADPNSIGDLYTFGGWRGRIMSGNQSYWQRQSDGSSTNFGDSSTFNSTDIVGFSMDFDNNEFKVYKTSDGSVVTTIDTSLQTGTNGGVGNFPWWLPAGGNETGASTTKTIHWNFGQDNFAISGGIPSGFKAISEANKAESAISPVSSATHAGGGFKAKTYTGNGGSPGTQSVNVGFRPDLVILKSRVQTYTPYLFDSIRGDQNYILPSESNPEASFNGTSDGFQFESTGFQVLATGGSAINESGHGADNMVSYSWKAGGAPTADNVATSGAMTANSVSLNGTLQSAYTPSGSPTVYPKRMSINTDYGFSIVEYNTGSNGTTMTVPHGLGRQPKVIWLKGGYDDSSYNWDTLFQWLPTGGTNYQNGYNGHLGRIKLNSSDDFENIAQGDVPWGDTRPTSDVFTSSNNYTGSGTYYGTNKNNIAYCWTDIAGFSDFGFYRGNGDVQGTFVYTGFKPAFVLIKNVSRDATEWCIFDDAVEDDHNKYRRTVLTNLASNTASATTARINFLSNGFKPVGGGGTFVNTNTDAYIYMAFASMAGRYSSPLHRTGS